MNYPNTNEYYYWESKYENSQSLFKPLNTSLNKNENKQWTGLFKQFEPKMLSEDRSVYYGSLGMLAVPFVAVYGKAIGTYLLSELLEEAAGVPIPDGPVDLWKSEMKKQMRKEIGREMAEETAKRTTNSLDWDAVVPKKGKYKDQIRTDHVRLHNANDLSKDFHGIFKRDGVEVTNEAWAKAQHLGIAPDETGKLVVPFEGAGIQGGKFGNGEKLNNVTIHVVPGSNKIITAYPSQ
jgi:hypothetical protein